MAAPLFLASMATSAGNALKNVPKEVWKGVFIIALAGGGYLIARKAIRNAKRQGAVKSFGKSNIKGLVTQYANGFKKAFENDNFLHAGTDEDAIYQIASEMKRFNISFADVAKAYKALFNTDLFKKLNKELDTQEMRTFNNILQGSVVGGLDGVYLVGNENATIYNDDLKPVQTLKAKTLLGKQVQRLDDPKADRAFLGFSHKGRNFFVDKSNAITV